MASEPGLEADLAAVVKRGRARVAAAGERSPRRVGPIESALTGEARAIIADWQRDDGYNRALVSLAVTDPDLAIQ